MAHRSLEETIQLIAPSRRRGIPNPPTIGTGVSSDNGNLSGALSQAGQQIQQLQSVYSQQANLIAENTQALQGNTSAQSGHSAGGTLGSAASSLFGGALGFLSPIVSGIASLFGGGSSTPAALPIYTPPSPVAINSVVQAPAPKSQSVPQASAPAPGAPAQSSPAAQITVNVNAMDSQSFMDRSNDIADAVRSAMLNMHPINDVVADL
ncbi:MAG TPA: hypothetical protein VFC21_10595 [Bryobacteraceae bacterium]|nr:hypothetical protein [Bryobacteraceae bacterium]